MSLGKKIKEQRKLLGVNQQELADKLDMSLNSIKKMETDRMVPSLETFEKLINLFNVSADYMLSRDSKLEYQVDFESGMAKVGVIQKIVRGEPSRTHVFVDPSILRGRKTMAYKVEDESMSGDNINTGDIVVTVETDNINEKDIFLTFVKSEILLRRIISSDEYIMLIASNPEFPPFIKRKDDDSFEIYRTGKVIQIVKYIERDNSPSN